MSFFAVLTEDGSYALTGAGYTALVIAMAALLLLGCFVFKADEKANISARKLVFSAIAMALAFVSSSIKIIHMPMGGSVTLFSMFFITLIGYWYGTGMGLLAAVSYGILQMIVDPYIIGVPQLFCDYIFAFGALGLSGLLRNARGGMIKGYLLGVAGRFLFSFLSGYIFFGMYAPEGMNPAVYSFLYNGAYLFAEAALTVVVAMIPAVASALRRVKAMALGEG